MIREQFAAPCQVALAMAVREQAEVADPHEALRQHVQKERLMSSMTGSVISRIRPPWL